MHTKEFLPTVFYRGKAGYITYEAHAGGNVCRFFQDRHDGFDEIVDLIASNYFSLEAGIGLVQDMGKIDKALRYWRA